MRASLLVAVTLVGCSLALPIDEPPGHCAEVTKFAFVGSSTLRGLGFDNSMGEFGTDFDRPGHFWITQEPLAVRDNLNAAEQAAIARARAEDALAGSEPPMPAPEDAGPVAAQRMLCVTWADGDTTGLVEMAIPDDWSPPGN